MLHLQRAGEDGGYDIPVPLKAVFGGTINTAYLDQQIMEWIEDFKVGRSVPAFHLPASRTPPQTRYDGYLAFVKPPYTAEDFGRLHDRGLTALEVDAGVTPDFARWRTLFGLLKPTAGPSCTFTRSARVSAARAGSRRWRSPRPRWRRSRRATTWCWRD